MATVGTKPNVPVFVGSTFADMQSYRRKVRDALTQLEAVVRGMEQFGSKPGSPVEECLEVVRSCRLYIGLFGMRYGSVPDGYEQSMTHLEYDEAQKLKLPSLIYILDDNHSIPAKDVETGPGAERLQALKEHLKKRHLLSYFTTPEDLQARIIHDVPAQLNKMGVEVTGELRKDEEVSEHEILRSFEMVPRLFTGRQITIVFSVTDFRSAPAEECEALNLELGSTVKCYANVTNFSGRFIYVYGEKDVALALLAIPKAFILKARARTAFGVSKEVRWGGEEPVTITETQAGLVITEILSTDRPKP